MAGEQRPDAESGIRYDVDNTITVGNELVDARNARFVDNFGGTAPLAKVKSDLNNVRPRARLRVDADRRQQGRRFAAAPGSSTIRITSTTTTSTSTRRCSRMNRVNFNCNSTTDNPFYNAAEGLAAPRSPLSRLPGGALSAASRTSPVLGLIPRARRRRSRLTSACRTRVRRRRLLAPVPGASRSRPTTSTRMATTSACSATSISTSSNGQLVTIDPRFTAINMYQNLGWISYNALADAHQYRGTRLRTGISYTLSKATSNSLASGVGGGAATNPLDLSVDMDRPTKIVVTTWCGRRLVPVPARLPAGRHLSATRARFRTASAAARRSTPGPNRATRAAATTRRTSICASSKKFKLPAQQSP